MSRKFTHIVNGNEPNDLEFFSGRNPTGRPVRMERYTCASNCGKTVTRTYRPGFDRYDCKSCAAILRRDEAVARGDLVLMTPEQKIAAKKAYKELNVDRLREGKKRCTDRRKEHYRAKVKEWVDANKVQYLERRRANYARRMVEDPQYRIVNSLRARLQAALKHKSKKKIDATMKLVGCNAKELKQYLEKLFVDGMSWSNYGLNGWVIDHRLPIASFDLTDPEQQKRCFHYTNLQPLWAIENIIKSDKILPEYQMAA